MENKVKGGFYSLNFFYVRFYGFIYKFYYKIRIKKIKSLVSF